MPTPITELIKLSSTNTKEQITKVDRFTIKELRITNTDISNDRRVFLFIAKYSQSKSGYRRKRGGDRTTLITSSQLGDSEYFSLLRVEIPAGTTLVVLDKDFFIPENHYIFAETSNPEAFDIVINGYREEYQTQ
jgi:hypothetical protein|tara:strand:- start:545 stop:946 length:402 start_codon:yes stop_codon:yes gene_type:complete